jgi:NADH-quinone oxidoreductase subunit J
MASLIIFFMLAAIAVVAALFVVNVKSPVSSAMFLIVTMCSLAGLFVLMGAIFLAALQVIVYAGAIMVLFIFVIMLLNLRGDEFGFDAHRIQKYLGFVLVGIILVQGVLISSWAMKDFAVAPKMGVESQATNFIPDSTAAAVNYNSAHSVATTLFTRYTYPFEVTSVLLLAAIIGAVVIAKRRLPEPAKGEKS